MSKNSRIVLIIIVLVVVLGVAIALARRSSAPTANVDGTGDITEPGALQPAPTSTAGAPPAASTAHTVVMKDDVYTPGTFTVKKGDTVTFRNDGGIPQWPASAVHPTHLIYPEFDPRVGIAPGASWSFTFTKAGVWRWHDHIHAQVNGTITVEE